MPLIILDLFGVLILGSYKETCLWISKKYHLDYHEVYKIAYYKYFSAATLGKITEAKSFSLAAKELGLSETGAELRKIHMSFMKLNRPIFRLAQAWQKRGVKIVIFSKNTPPQFNEIVRLFSLRQYFPTIINSYNLGLEKKSFEALNYLSRRFRTSVDQILMIDDQNYNFVNAKTMGIKTLLYKTPRLLERDVNNWLKNFYFFKVAKKIDRSK